MAKIATLGDGGCVVGRAPTCHQSVVQRLPLMRPRKILALCPDTRWNCIGAYPLAVACRGSFFGGVSMTGPFTDRLPFVIGVVGHRDLRDQDLPRLKAEVGSVIDRLKRDY